MRLLNVIETYGGSLVTCVGLLVTCGGVTSDLWWGY